MQDAMQRVRDEIGEEAVIVSTRKQGIGRGVELTVAYVQEEEDAPSPPLPNAKPNACESDNAPPEALQRVADYMLREVEQLLEYHGAGSELSEYIVDFARYVNFSVEDSPSGLQQVLARALSRAFRFVPVPFAEPVALGASGNASTFMLIGAAGAGKTQTTAKIAARIKQAGGAVHVVNADYHKAGAVEQLAALTTILGVPMDSASTPDELYHILQTIDPATTVIIDSAGTNPYDYEDLKELSAMATLDVVTPVLVYPAGGDPIESTDIARAFSFLGVEQLMFTRTDASRRYGGILSAAYAGNLAFSHMTGTQKILGSFEPVTPESLAALLLQSRGGG